MLFCVFFPVAGHQRQPIQQREPDPWEDSSTRQSFLFWWVSKQPNNGKSCLRKGSSNFLVYLIRGGFAHLAWLQLLARDRAMQNNQVMPTPHLPERRLNPAPLQSNSLSDAIVFGIFDRCCQNRLILPDRLGEAGG